MPRGWKAKPQVKPRIGPELPAETQRVSREQAEKNPELERPKDCPPEVEIQEAKLAEPVEEQPESMAGSETQTSERIRSKRGAREEPTEGLRPAGVQRLRDLRAENDELRNRIVELERRVENSTLELGVVRLVDPQTADVITQDASVSETSGSAGARTAEKKKDGKRTRQIVCDVVFYLAIILMLSGAAVMRTMNGGAPVTIAGYSGMIVLTSSMQDVIPKGSFILTKSVDPETLQVGDDITFMVDEKTTMTHRIVDIAHQGNGALTFQTKGTNNQTADRDVVYSTNVVGVVIYHSLVLGKIAQWVKDNWPLLMFLLVVVAVLSWVLARIAVSDEKESGRRVKKKERRGASDGELPDGDGDEANRAPPEGENDAPGSCLESRSEAAMGHKLE